MGLILATLLMSSFYYGKDTNLYKGALRWGFVAIGAAAFVDIYSVWFNSLTDIANVPYGTTGGRYTDSYKLVEHQSMVNGYFDKSLFCSWQYLSDNFIRDLFSWPEKGKNYNGPA